MKKNGKMRILLALCAWMAILAMGCSKTSKLPEGFTEEAVKAQAEADIKIAESGNYEEWLKRFPEEVQAQLGEDSFNAYLSVLEEKGAFQEFGKTAFVGQEQDGAKYAGVIYIVKHENGQIQYTIGYNEKMQLIQFLAK